jgi:hypothetical protein
VVVGAEIFELVVQLVDVLEVVVEVVVPSDTPEMQGIQPTEGINADTHGKNGQDA